jgi:hypothetical protein
LSAICLSYGLSACLEPWSPGALDLIADILELLADEAIEVAQPYSSSRSVFILESKNQQFNGVSFTLVAQRRCHDPSYQKLGSGLCNGGDLRADAKGPSRCHPHYTLKHVDILYVRRF